MNARHPFAQRALATLVGLGIVTFVSACGEDVVTDTTIPMEVSADFVNGPATKIKYDSNSENEYYTK